METVHACLYLPIGLSDARQAFWDYRQLASLWERILDFRMLYQDARHQEAWMRVERDGRWEDIRILRFLEGKDILFFNPVPPPMMTQHAGAWTFREAPGEGTLIGAFRKYSLRRGQDENMEKFAARRAEFRISFQVRLQRILESVRAICPPARGDAAQSPAMETGKP